MSSLVIVKDHPKHGKANPSRVIEVPFLEARDLVAAGFAKRWNGGAGLATVEVPPTVTHEAHERAGKKILELEAKIKDMQAELEAAAAASQKAVAESERLAKENQSLAEQLNAARAAAGDSKKK